jgi:hypothetical protein
MSSVRIAAHVHSSWSYDGQWSLDKIAGTFRRLRYDVVLMAEHDRGFDEDRWSEYQRACAAAATPDLLLVPGMEYSDPDNVVHTVVWGTSVPFLGEGKATLDVLRAASDHGAITLFAHPWRRNAIARYRPDWAPLLSAVEIWNRKYDGVAPNADALAMADRLGLARFVSLDFHTSRQLFPLALSARLSGARSCASVIGALADRAYRPEFLGLPAAQLTDGLEGAILRDLEGMRRHTMSALRGRLRGSGRYGSYYPSRTRP